MSEKILSVNNLKVSFRTYAGDVQAVRDVDFHLNMGETLAIVGESGSGKTVTSKAIMRLLPEEQAIIGEGSKISFGDIENLLSLSENEMITHRGSEISMIFQDPMTSLNPTMTVGNQIAESIIIHEKNVTADEVKKRTLEILNLVRIPNPETRLKQYPFELSGGMRQRIMIAIALLATPKC